MENFLLLITISNHLVVTKRSGSYSDIGNTDISFSYIRIKRKFSELNTLNPAFERIDGNSSENFFDIPF